MFISTEPYIYQGVRERTGKNDNKYQLMTFANPRIYETYDFFVTDDFDPFTLMAGKEYNLTLELRKRGFNNNFNIVKATLADKARA